MDDLRKTEKMGSGKLGIINLITASPSSQCVKFAELLLRDTATVIKLREENDDDMFVHAVLSDWLSRDDEDPDDPAVARTWKSLAQSMEDAGLDSVLIQEVRDRFC